MIYTPMTMKAMKIAYDAHHGKIDKSGAPFILHPFHVAEQMTSEDSTVVALLHDVPEDTKVTLAQLRKAGFNENVLEALRLLKHEPKVPYLEYIDNMKHNLLAREVKLKDIAHNSDPARIYKADVKIFARLVKYGLALSILRDAEKDYTKQEVLAGMVTAFIKLPKETRMEEIQISAETIMKEVDGIKRGAYSTISGACVEAFDNSFVFEDVKSKLFAKLERKEDGKIDVQLKIKKESYIAGANPAIDGEVMCYLEGIANDIRILQYDSARTRKALIARNKGLKKKPLFGHKIGREKKF